MHDQVTKNCVNKVNIVYNLIEIRYNTAKVKTITNYKQKLPKNLSCSY